jgi:RND family efflux transporter MFP subunit
MRTFRAAIATVALLSTPLAAAEYEIREIERTDYKAVFGQVESRDVATARARIGGTVTELRVDEGSEVNPGDVIAVVVDDKLSIQAKAIDARMSALEVQLANTQNDLQRAQRLVQSGVVPKTQVEGYQTQVNVLLNQIVALKADRSVVDQQASEGSVLAPSAGRVIDVPTTHGSVLMPGEAVARIAGGGYFLRLALPERHAAQIVEGSEVLVGQRGAGASGASHEQASGTLKGKLVKIYPEIQGGRVTADVEVTGLGDFFVGERTSVWIPVDKRKVLAVPQSAVETRYGVDYVKVVINGQTTDVAIVPGTVMESTTESKDGPLLEVLSGLTAGDKVLVP